MPDLEVDDQEGRHFSRVAESELEPEFCQFQLEPEFQFGRSQSQSGNFNLVGAGVGIPILLEPELELEWEFSEQVPAPKSFNQSEITTYEIRLFSANNSKWAGRRTLG